MNNPAPSNHAAPPALRYCERCGFPTFKLHCKIRCTNCGHFLDCGDLDIPGAPPSRRTPPRTP